MPYFSYMERSITFRKLLEHVLECRICIYAENTENLWATTEQIRKRNMKIIMRCWQFSISINHRRHTSGGEVPHLPYGATPGGHASRVSMQAPFPYWVTLSRRHQLDTAKSFVGAPLASSKLGYLLQKQPDKQDQLPDIPPHVHIAAVGADGLC